jgi:hypothetical protein
VAKEAKDAIRQIRSDRRGQQQNKKERRGASGKRST